MYDKELFSLRRRLLLALRNPKAYMDSIYIEYTGEEYEVNVRPSDPFKAGSTDLEASAALKISSTPISMPTSIKEDLVADLEYNVGNPIVLEVNPTIDASVALGIDTAQVYMIQPIDIVTEEIEAIVDMAGAIDPVDTLSTDAEIHVGTYGVGATAKLIRKPSLKPIINAVDEFGIDSTVDCIEMPSMKLDVKAQFNADGVVKIGLYVAATLAELGTENLSYWADMPLDTEYISKGTPPLFMGAL